MWHKVFSLSNTKLHMYFSSFYFPLRAHVSVASVKHQMEGKQQLGTTIWSPCGRFSMHTETGNFQASDVVTCVLCWRPQICLQMNHRNVYFLIISSRISCHGLFCFTYGPTVLVQIPALASGHCLYGNFKITNVNYLSHSCQGLWKK